jgi:UDP-N-acetyl-D-mannosaminuronate dehydrogenase
MKVGILGVGEVGSAIKQLYDNADIKHEVYTKDISFDNFPEQLDVLNICVPYKDRESFIGMVKPVIDKHKPHWSIIHSTVGVGTTKELEQRVGSYVVHSPVRGIHPNIYTGLKTFPKFFGSYSDAGEMLTSMHYNAIGLHPWCVGSPETSETLKLWDTTVYGINIALGKHIKKFCEKHGADYNLVMTIAAKTYNDGFQNMGNDTYRRYAIKDTEGKIGGHCVIPNAEILFKEDKDSFATLLLQLNDGY